MGSRETAPLNTMEEGGKNSKGFIFLSLTPPPPPSLCRKSKGGEKSNKAF